MNAKKTCSSLENCMYYKEYQRYKKGLDAAKEIQLLLLGQVPKISGFDIAYSFVPSEEMSGDFFNVSLLENDQNHIYIADATGHGVAASSIMLTARAYMKALSQYHKSPTHLVRTVNELLCTDRLHGKFVTLFYGVLDLKNKIFNYTCAGHNPPLLFKRGKKECIELARTGPALGMTIKLPFSESNTHLESGDILILYTDGIVERENQQQNEFDTNEISKVVLSNIHKSAQDICDNILKEANRFDPISEQDDMTILTLKVH